MTNNNLTDDRLEAVANWHVTPTGGECLLMARELQQHRKAVGELEAVKAQLKAAQAHITELEMAPPAPAGPGEEPVPVMPDFPGRVMTQRECYRAGWAAHHTAMLQAGAPVQFGWSKGHFGYQTLFNAIGKAVKVQGNALSISVSAFEDAMSAAAPQLQEDQTRKK